MRVARVDRYMAYFNPDISWIARVCGGFAAIWALARSALILHEEAKR